MECAIREGAFWWTGLASWDFDIPFPGSFISTFLFRVYGSPLRVSVLKHRFRVSVEGWHTVKVLGSRHMKWDLHLRRPEVDFPVVWYNSVDIWR